jgi:ABC-type branched-subunit amino acid transport system substrate-binding protein
MRASARAAIALFLVLCACPKRVTVNGQEMPAAEASAKAQDELGRLRTELAQAPDTQAAQAFEDFAGRAGEVPEAGEALFDAGIRWRRAGRPERADRALGQLLARFPLSPRALEAKVQLGLAELEQGRPKEGLATLSSLYDKLPPGERLGVARAAAEAAEKARAFPQALRFRAEVARQVEGADRARELERAAEDVDQLTFLEVAKLREELPGDSPVLPPVLLKLAKVRLHLRDQDGAAREARELTARFPATPWTAEAQALLDRLARRTRVQPNVIGVAVPLSGRSKPWGEAIVQGVALALDGGPFRIAIKDTRGEPDGAAEALEALAVEEGAVAVIGGVTNAEALRAAQAAQELDLPFLSLSKVEKITEVGPDVFRVMLTADAQARALAEWAMVRRGMKRFAVMYPGIPYGLELAGAFWDEVEARGGEIRGAESYEPDRTTFAPLVKSMVGKLYLDERPDYQEQLQALAKEEKDPFRRRKAMEKLREKLAPVTDFDAIFIPDFASKVAQIAPALAVEDVVTATCDSRELERIRKATDRQELLPVQLLGANGWDDPALLERAGRYVECAVFVDGFYAASQRPATRTFADLFTQKFGHAPTILEASAHDAARLVRLALEKGARSREAVRQALAQTKGFAGATGDLAFDERREVQKPLFFLTVEKGAVRELSRAELAAAGAP